MRPTIAEINLSHIKYNFLNIRKKVKKAKVMAVVKADAYGHGSVECCYALNELGIKKPDYYGVALLEEGIELRESGIKEPILSFAPFDKTYLSFYTKFKIEPTVCTEQQIGFLKRYKGRKITVQVNVDTGMGRLGLNYKDAAEKIISLAENKNVVVSGVYTHFATSDDRDKTYALLQLERFSKVVEKLRSKGINTIIFHAANSGAILDLPDSYLDMVRVGISLYGYYPSMETSESIKLRPVMSLVSQISTTKTLEKGDSVSYGRLFTAKRKMNSATIPIGYADGLSRNLTNKIKVIVNKKFFSQIGRVTMDRIMVNTGMESFKLGTRVILIGKSGDKRISAWDWSKILNTIPYEITCNIGKRIPRKYIH